MAEGITRPVTEQMREAFDNLDATPPFRLHEQEAAVIVDAKGRPVMTVDVNRERTDEQVEYLAYTIVLACNAACGINTFLDEIM